MDGESRLCNWNGGKNNCWLHKCAELCLARKLGGAEEGVREGAGGAVVFGVEDAGVYSKWNIDQFER